jgi:hypothetical protein
MRVRRQVRETRRHVHADGPGPQIFGRSPPGFRADRRELGPCDVVLADIEAGPPDSRVLAAVRFCEELSSLS